MCFPAVYACVCMVLRTYERENQEKNAHTAVKANANSVRRSEYHGTSR